jgi:hypothetical protein
MRDLPEYALAGFRSGENCLMGKAIDDFCEQIVRVSRDAALCMRLTQEAYRLAEANSLEHVGLALRRLYTMLLERRAR